MSVTTRLGTADDFETLSPLLEANCARLQLDWANYGPVAKQILADIDYGFFVIAEVEGAVAAFVFFTYEWSDWRDGVFYWIQGMETAGEQEDSVFKAIRAFVDSYKGKYKCCGVRLCGEKTLREQHQEAVKIFELTTSHYYIYNVDTPNQE